MALTIDQNSLVRVSEGNKWRILGKLSLDNSYPAGGYPIIPAQIGLDQVQSFIVNDNQLGYMFDYDFANLHVYEGAGGSFVGSPMAPHTHLSGYTTEDIDALSPTYITIGGATGSFTIGETITGGTSGATAVVASLQIDPVSDLGFTPGLGIFSVGETITGGTSGVTAIVGTGWFKIYIPSLPPVILEAASIPTLMGRGLYTTSRDLNSDLKLYYNTLVGAFVDFEIITGGTSGSTAQITFRNEGSMIVGQVVWATVGFLLGETITGGTSGATAVVTCSEFSQTIIHRTTSTTSPTGDFIVFYPVSVNATPLRVTYYSEGGIQAASAGTPSGTVSTGPGSEVPVGTPLGFLKSIEFEATGL